MNNANISDRLNTSKVSTWLADNVVSLIFVAFTLFGFLVSDLSLIHI